MAETPNPKASPNPEPDEILPSARFLFDTLIGEADSSDVESVLSSTGIPPTDDIVHQVLKLCYANAPLAITFFRWAGRTRKLNPYAWNLMVDLLGKNLLFNPMWDAIRSMKEEAILSTATFVSVFESYSMAAMFSDAIMSFDCMDKYGVPQDVVAVNSLLSSICRQDGQAGTAMDFFDKIKSKIHPNADTFTILLEGWEKECNVARAKTTFGEMVIRIGWSPQYVSAYDSFLTTLVCGLQAAEAIKFLKVMKGKDCLPGLKFFSNALHMLVKHNDAANAIILWDTLVDSGLLPNLIMYNAMIGLLCDNNHIDKAICLLDEMVFNGAFPDFMTYTMIFRSLIKNKKVRMVGSFFSEMIKNENPPTQLDCAAAIKLLFYGDDPEMAIDIWNYLIENCVSHLDVSANEVLMGFLSLNRLSEVKRFADDMLDRRINIYESTMAKLKSAFHKEGRNGRDKYDDLFMRWKAR